MATGEESKQDDVVAIELPSPSGWVKKFTPMKGGTPTMNAIVFISPDGEEIKNKRQLDQYLKSHPGGPAAVEFDWGTGDTPRRSVRLSLKSKAPECSMSSSPKKRRKKMSPKVSDEKENANAEIESGETKEDANVDMNEARGSEVISEKAISEKPDTGQVETETVTNDVLGKPSVTEAQNDTETKPDSVKVETKAVLDRPSADEIQNSGETENLNCDVPKSNDMAPEVPSAAETHIASNTGNFNVDVEIMNATMNGESEEALLKKKAETQNDAETENVNANTQKYTDMAPEVPYATETCNASSSENFNVDVEKFDASMNESKETVFEKPNSEIVETVIATAAAAKAVLDKPCAVETQNDTETVNLNSDVQKSNDVAPEVYSAADNTDNFDVEEFYAAMEEYNEAADGKSNCVEPAVDDKNKS